MATEYRIDFTITRRTDGDKDFAEVGFGSSGAWGTVEGAAYEAQSIIQNRMWETGKGMPEPEDV